MYTYKLLLVLNLAHVLPEDGVLMPKRAGVMSVLLHVAYVMCMWLDVRNECTVVVCLTL
jgi:hypothetical protein